MKGPTSRPHRLDLWDPVVQLPYLGDPAESFLALARSDGWDVDLYDDTPPDPANPRSHVVTLQARYDYVPVRVRAGRVVAIGAQAPFLR